MIDEGDATSNPRPQAPQDSCQPVGNAAQGQDIQPQPALPASAAPQEISSAHLDPPADHDTTPTPKPKTPKRVRIAEVPSSQSPDVTPVSIRFEGKGTEPVSPQSPTRNPRSPQPETAASLNLAANTWTQTQTTPSTRRKVMDFNARWAELSKSPSYAVKHTPARTATRRHADDQNTFALGEETQAALLEAEAALSSSDIYTDDEILGDPEINVEPQRSTVAAKSGRLSATSDTSALDTVDRPVAAELVSRNEAPNGTSVTRHSANNSGAPKTHGRPTKPPTDHSDDIGKSRADDCLDGRNAKVESQATAITCMPGETNPGDGLANPHSSPPGAIVDSSPVLPRRGYASLGQQFIEDSQDPPVEDLSSDELTLSQLLAGSLVNSSIPRPPHWSDSVEYR